MSVQDQPSTLLLHYEGASPPAADIKAQLEKGDVMTKVATMKRLIRLQLSGEPQNHHIMTVIKHCVPEDHHVLKKLLIYFWECVDKTDDDGNLLPEMILLCSFLRTDLQHPNEYVRGFTLRFFCKLRERDVLEPLISSLVPNLTHRVNYVRRNAVLAVHAVYSRFPQLLPDAPELVEEFLIKETDVSAQRHAFNMLFQCSQERAVRALARIRDEQELTQLGDAFQVAVVESSKQLIAANPHDKGKYVPFISSALNSKSPAVLFQCANSLLALSTFPTAIKQATSTLTHLLTTHSDNNARLIVLDRLVEMRGKFGPVLEDSLMDILRGLATANAELRQRIVELAVDLVTGKNIDAFIVAMKKELIRSQSDDFGDAAAQQEYRQQIVAAIHKTVTKNLDVAATVVPILLDYICEPGAHAHDVIIFIREVMLARPELQETILSKLAAMFHMITSGTVLRTVLWLFGVHCSSPEHIVYVAAQLKQALEPFPLQASDAAVEAEATTDGPSTVATTTVREDGTYVMSIELVRKNREVERSDLTGVRAQIVNGDYFLAAALANTLSKLVVHLFSTHAPKPQKTALQTDVVEILRELVRYGTSRQAVALMDDDCHERIVTALAIVQNPHNEFVCNMVEESVTALAALRGTATQEAADEEVPLGDVDQPLVFSQLFKGQQAAFEFAPDDVQQALSNEGVDKESSFASRLARVVQLTGFSDPVYAEATVTVHEFDILVDLYAVNQTGETLSNFTVELAAAGDLKLCERPQTYILPPGASVSMKTNIKVGSTETGVITGNVLFETGAAAAHNCVILNEIRVDIMEYIRPATCAPAAFRDMWILFEWENKVNVAREQKGLLEYVQHIMALTNMQPIEPLPTDECGFLTVSLYARSTFGEDALANVSLERMDDGFVEGVVRIRSKTQGIALGLGDKISSKGKQ